MLDYAQRHPFEVNNNRDLPVSLRVRAWVCVYMRIKCGHVPGESPPHSWSHLAGWPEGEKTGGKRRAWVFTSAVTLCAEMQLSHMVPWLPKGGRMNWAGTLMDSDRKKLVRFFFFFFNWEAELFMQHYIVPLPDAVAYHGEPVWKPTNLFNKYIPT